MEINVREWKRGDLPELNRAWLDFCRGSLRPDMQLVRDPEAAMMDWLSLRFEEPDTLGLIAEAGAEFAGFVIGRIAVCETIPPVTQPRKMGIIDALYVHKPFRGNKVGTRLIERVLQIMGQRHATVVETTYDAWREEAAQTWTQTGFKPSMVHAYRML